MDISVAHVSCTAFPEMFVCVLCSVLSHWEFSEQNRQKKCLDRNR